MQKREISSPNLQHQVTFWMVKKDIHNMQPSDMETLVNSIVLDELLAPELATYKKYSYQEINHITSYGITLNAFCCHKSKEELKELGHKGALAWIEKFEHTKNKSGKPLPIALKKSGKYWYEMDDAAKADLVTAVNPDRRLFVAKFQERTFVDQRFTRMLLKSEQSNSELIHAILNSIYGMFAIEAIGFGRGLAVLDTSSTRLKNMFMIDVDQISEQDAEEIVRLFEKIKNREVMDIEDELKDPERKKFDHKVLESIGAQDLYDKIKESLVSLQHTRHCIK